MLFVMILEPYFVEIPSVEILASLVFEIPFSLERLGLVFEFIGVVSSISPIPSQHPSLVFGCCEISLTEVDGGTDYTD